MEQMRRLRSRWTVWSETFSLFDDRYWEYKNDIQGRVSDARSMLDEDMRVGE